jgi:uncharacterized protein (TIGR02466 family)
MITNLHQMFTCSAVSTKLNLNLHSYCENLYNNSDKNNYNRSNINGWQSQDIKDEVSKDLILAINILSQSYKSAIYLNKNIKVSNMWINRNSPNSYNKEHIHPGCIFAGVYYVTVPKNSGKIKFINPAEHMIYDWKNNYFCKNNEFNSNIWWLPVEENVLYLFPSWMKHEVTMNKSNDTRISISFNLDIDD